jgi:hypothetical protein
LPKYLFVASVATLSLLSACGAKSDAPVKRQPGSWSTKAEILELAGKGVKLDGKIQLQQYFDLLTLNALCLTPEMAARDDIRRDIENASGAGKDCRFDKQKLSGETVEFSGMCSDGAKKVRVSAQGTSGATARDLIMTVEQLGADGKPEGMMKMRTLVRRTGDCQAGDGISASPPKGATR